MGTRFAWAEPAPAALKAFEAYRVAIENRLTEQHRSQHGFLAPCSADQTTAELRLWRGEFIVERIDPVPAVDGALLHHWRGTAFVAGAKAADFLRLMQDFDRYPQRYAPEVERAHLLKQEGERFDVSMRIRQKHVITVVMDTDYAIQFGQLDEGHGYSTSRSTRVTEIDSADTSAEHALSAKDEHGFLWKLNSYWSYEERDGGLYLQIEAISLTRAIPAGLGWVVRPYVESIPRESLEFTLRSTANGLRR